eukprot:gnl/TRDRNA2_/TRDRNA2_159501_c0_seq3.p1 gnl/TRDRNA2_/TRDRNA2_159501_c0~~gnl/TRDRNA2_/TRDRNA2_159501_c0_seq3.p1  ORF type:complete len:230 (-),score=12.86 gnl/TRDRNA2_/TRDRNA2_159501_c0_seq3:26-682(-)
MPDALQHRMPPKANEEVDALRPNTAGETEAYAWGQTDDEIEITFKTKGLQRGDAKLVKVIFYRTSIRVDVKGEVLLEGNLQHAIDTESSTWTISDGDLQVTLAKAKVQETWHSLLNLGASATPRLKVHEFGEKASDEQRILSSVSNRTDDRVSLTSRPYDYCVAHFIPGLIALASCMLLLVCLRRRRTPMRSYAWQLSPHEDHFRLSMVAGATGRYDS